MRRLLTGLGATLLLALLLVGLPVLLVVIWPVGLPHVQPSPAGIWSALLRPDDGTVFLTLVKVAGWIVWALLVVSIGAEILARLRRHHPPRLPGLAIPQGLARGLVAASLTLFVNTNTTLGPTPPPVAQAAPASPNPATPQTPHVGHAEAGKPSFERYTVKKGDILSQIALDHLGDAHRYPAIFKASRHIRQPGGRHLTDPDVIDIGWKLNIPTSHTTKPDHQPANGKHHQPDRTREDPPSALQIPAEVPATPAPSTPPVTANPAHSTDAVPDAPATPTEDEPAQPAWLLTGLAGAGALLAGSLWLVVLRRRAVQHHHRRPGYATAPPPPHTIPVEQTLRHQGGPAGDVLTFLDEALRRLAATLDEPLPGLLAVAATPVGIRLHLAEDATLPEPWQQAGTSTTVWSLDAADVPRDVEPLEPDSPAPWPHLATVGADDTGRWWLINLENPGITTIGGDPDYADDLARYLAAELATTPWSRDVQVDLIGAYPELADLDPTRLHHHTNPDAIDDTIAAAVDTIDRLNRLHLDDLPAARAAHAGDEIWLNRVLITTTDTAGHLDQLAPLIQDQPGRTATAILLTDAATTGAPGMEITVGADGRVRIPTLGLDLIANGITPDEARGCAQLLQAAEVLADTDLPSAGDDGWRQHVDQAGRLNPDLTEPRDPDGGDPHTTNLPQPDTDVLQTAATTSEDLAVLAPTIPEPVAEQLRDSDPTLDADLADWFSDTCTRPRLSVLGPIRVRVGAGGDPGKAAKRKPYYTELVAYLATRPHGATSVEFCNAFDVTPARLQRDLAVVRQWLGKDPTTGERHLPDAIRSQLFHDGHGVYQLHNLLSDADLFRRLRLRGQTRGTEGLTDYLQALSLVTGRPYKNLHDGGGTWLAADRDDQHLLVAIVDTAHLAVTMALQVPDLKMARLAADLAATVAPDEEAPDLDLAAVAQAEGDTARAGRAIREVLHTRDADGPIQPSPRTTRLVQTHGWGDSARTSTS